MKTTTRSPTATRRWPARSPISSELSDYLTGLRAHPKRLPCKLLYDAEGSRLFEEISGLEEYYLTRTEMSILRARGPELASLLGEGVAVVELGSGSDAKVRLLLEHLKHPAVYVPVEISREQLRQSCAALTEDFPTLRTAPLCADYTNGLHLSEFPPEARRTLFFFPGSTLGNFEPIEALAFLQKLARLGGAGAMLLIGVDLKKDPSVLEAAYNDRRGITAAFNLNILARANREFGATFDLSGFGHRATWDEEHRRVVLQLESLREQDVELAGERIAFAAGERITTEYSYKYTCGEFGALARLAGFSPCQTWTDSQERFSLHLLAVR